MIEKEYIVNKDIYLLLNYLENIFINDNEIEEYRNIFIDLLEQKLYHDFPKGDIKDEKVIIKFNIDNKIDDKNNIK